MCIKKTISCDSGLPDHQVIVREFVDGDVTITMRLPKLSIWKRIKALFTGYPRFEEVMTTKEELNKLFK